MNTLYDIAIIGAGGAGQMAILRAVLNHQKTVAFLGDAQTLRKSRAAWVAEVENVPGMFDWKRPISKTTQDVLRFIEGREDLKPFLTAIKQAVNGIEKKDEHFILKTADQQYQARYVVLCSGTMDVQPIIRGSIKPIFPYANREDVYYCIRCDGHKTVGKKCAVIGHASGAGWIAIMLHERYQLPKIWVLSNGKPFEGDEEVRKLLAAYKIDVIEDPIDSIAGSPKTGLEGFQVGEKLIPAAKAFVALGSIVYNDLAKQLGASLDERDHVITDVTGQSSVAGFYAAGDLVAGKKKQVYTAWDSAVDAVDAIDAKLRKSKRNL